MAGWRVIEEETLCDTGHLRVAIERVATPSRPMGVIWTVAHRAIAAVVAPRTPQGKFLLIRQERVAARQVLWEFPAGQVDEDPTEASIREAALRELGEEAAVRCTGELIPLGHYFSSPGFTDECEYLFLATDVVPLSEKAVQDEHEAILEVRAFTTEELRAMIAAGEILDANTLATYARMQAKNLIP